MIRHNKHKKEKEIATTSSTTEDSTNDSEESYKLVENVDPRSVTSISDFFTQ